MHHGGFRSFHCSQTFYLRSNITKKICERKYYISVLMMIKIKLIQLVQVILLFGVISFAR